MNEEDEDWRLQEIEKENAKMMELIYQQLHTIYDNEKQLSNLAAG